MADRGLKQNIESVVRIGFSALGATAPMLATVQDGQLTLASGLTALLGGAGAVLASILAGRETAVIHDDATRRISQANSLLENQNWHRLVARAVYELILVEAEKQENDHQPLADLAESMRDEWLELLEHPTFAEQLTALSKSAAMTSFDPHAGEPSALDEETWTVLLTAIGKKHDCLAGDETKQRLAKILTERLPHAIYDLLCDPEVGGKAFAGLVISFLAEIHGAVVKTLPQFAAEMRAADADYRQRLDELSQRLTDSMARLVERLPSGEERETYQALLAEERDRWDKFQTSLDKLHEGQQRIEGQLDVAISKADEILQAVSQPTSQPLKIEKPTYVQNGRISNLHRQITERRLFVGRKTLLKQLRQALTDQRAAAITQTQAIHGLGGVGKTQLAVEYASQHAGEYDIVWWIRAESPATIVSDLAELAEPLGLIEPGQAVQDITALAQGVLGVLAGKSRWLLIYDNAVTPEDLQGSLPGGEGHVLLTSRHSDWGQIAGSFTCDVLNKTDARKLLLERSGQSDRAAADEIAARLGRLPLALEVAGAYCAETGEKLANYIDLLDEVGLPLLDESQPLDYHAVVSATWTPSFAKAVEQSLGAAAVLGLIAFLAPEDIPVDLLTDTVGGRKQLNHALAALLRYSLIQREGDLLSIHRLVQEVFREGLGDDAKREWAENSLQLLAVKFPKNIQTNVDEWETCESLSPHAMSVLNHAGEFSLSNDVATTARRNLATRLGTYHYFRAQFTIAEPIMRRTLAIDEAAFGEEHPEVTTDLNNLAQLLQATNRLAEAEPLMRRSLAIDEAAFGEEHPRVAIRLNNLAPLLQATNRLAEAEPLMRRALAIDEAAFGEKHPKVAIRLNNLAQLLQDTNRLAEAEPLMRRALAIDEAAFGEKHPEVATDLNNLASLLQATNRLAEAEPLMQRVVTIFENTYGESHPNVATALNNLASLLQATNRLAEAEPLMQRVVTIFESTYGEDHPNIATALNNLAQLLEATNRLAEAEPLMRRALAIDEAAYGEDHPEVAADLNNLASLLLATNRLAEAEPLMRRNLEIFLKFTKMTGHEHPHLRLVINNYAGLLLEMGHPPEEVARRIVDLCLPYGFDPRSAES